MKVHDQGLDWEFSNAFELEYSTLRRLSYIVGRSYVETKDFWQKFREGVERAVKQLPF